MKKLKQTRYLSALLAVLSVWLILTATLWLSPPKELSLSERRKLQQFPLLSVNSVLSGEFMTEFEKYCLDQFPKRDLFRTLKAVTSFYVFSQKDSNGIVMYDGYALQLEKELNESSVYGAAKKFTYIYDTYLKGTKTNIYLSIIPDKGYFSSEKSKFPTMDYDKLFSIMQQEMTFSKYIQISDALKLTNYYKTDTHWRQETLIEVSEIISNAMGATKTHKEYIKNTAPALFQGVYYGQSALPLKSESIYYLTNSVLDDCIVFNAETNKTGGLYDTDKLYSRDPYEFFLTGASPIIVIDNPNCNEARELVIFRDSFASSLAPLLVEEYSKITLIDTRYIGPDLIGNYIDFNNQDVLFLYSTLILNSSATLR